MNQLNETQAKRAADGCDGLRIVRHIQTAPFLTVRMLMREWGLEHERAQTLYCKHRPQDAFS